jgi:predicted nuclease with TOPRIM domain
MQLQPEFSRRILFCLILALLGAYSAFGGVSRQIQDQYKHDYENKAIFLKIPIYSEKQLVYVNAQKIRAEQGLGAPRYKVGDQLRILQIDFAGDEIKFKMGAISSPIFVELIFKFDGSLQESFPNKDVFDRALQFTFAEGLKYAEIEEAKRNFIVQEFDRYLREIVVAASINRETVLKNVAAQVPAYVDAQHEIDNLKDKLQDASTQLNQSQAENRKLESNQKAQQTELASLKSANASLQGKIDSFTSQFSRLGEDLRTAKGTTQGYQQEIANIQRSLNIKVEANRDISMQMADVSQAIRKLQKDNENLSNQVSSTRTNLDAQQAANARLVSDNEELKSKNQQMQGTIKTLSSNEDSLAKKYMDLKNAKDQLDDYAQVVKALHTRIVEEKNEAGVYSGKANLYLKNTLLGSIDWRLPANVKLNEGKTGEIGFSAESIDYVRLTPEERHMLHSLGDRWKMRIDLISNSERTEISPQIKESLREIGERERSTWKWTINKNGSQDARLLISARLINHNSQEISFFQQEQAILASDLVRQVRGYLQPIPLATGALIGFLIFGIVGIFRRPKRPSSAKKDPEPSSYAGRKEL